jgi:hypothetical protein
MKFLRSIAADLVDKRLLPVVIALVALAVAIPVGASLFSGGGSAKPVPVSPGKTIDLPAGTPSPAKALEQVAGPDTPTPTHYKKPELNPFRDTATTTAATTSASTTSAAKSATPATSSSSSTTTKTATKTTTPAKKTTPVKKTTPAPVTPTPSSAGAPVAQLASLRSVDSYSVDVRVEDATGLRNISDLERLSPVPSATNALAEYLGVAKSGRSADFVLNPGVTVTGPAACLPSATDCQVIELKPGQVEGLLQSTSTGTPVFQGALAVTNWGVVTHSSVAAADTARRQEDQTGRQLMLASAQPALEKLVYTVAQGVVGLLSDTVNSVTGLLSGTK